jgi:hypothetical protein
MYITTKGNQATSLLEIDSRLGRFHAYWLQSVGYEMRAVSFAAWTAAANFCNRTLSPVSRSALLPALAALLSTAVPGKLSLHCPAV